MFTPGTPPTNPAALAAYVADLERRISFMLLNPPTVLQLREVAVAPSRLADGMVSYADGTNWNPGAGEGLYEYRNGRWSRVGSSLSLVSKSSNYTFVSGDENNVLFLHPSADTSARTWTIPANASVAYPVGSTLTFVNQNGAGALSIAITSDTMRLSGPGTTGTRTLTANGMASAFKLTSTEWIINGVNLT